MRKLRLHCCGCAVAGFRVGAGLAPQPVGPLAAWLLAIAPRNRWPQWVLLIAAHILTPSATLALLAQSAAVRLSHEKDGKEWNDCCPCLHYVADKETSVDADFLRIKC